MAQRAVADLARGVVAAPEDLPVDDHAHADPAGDGEVGDVRGMAAFAVVKLGQPQSVPVVFEGNWQAQFAAQPGREFVLTPASGGRPPYGADARCDPAVHRERED